MRTMTDVHTVQKAAFYFGVVNLVVGIAGFIGPFVTGNNDGIININPGYLFGMLGINWLHAAAHVLFGVAGMSVRTNYDSSVTYMWVVAVVFAAMAAMGFMQFGMQSGLYSVMGMTVDRNGNVVHTVLALIGLYFALRPHAGETRHRAATY